MGNKSREGGKETGAQNLLLSLSQFGKYSCNGSITHCAQTSVILTDKDVYNNTLSSLKNSEAKEWPMTLNFRSLPPHSTKWKYEEVDGKEKPTRSGQSRGSGKAK
ncbi:hypothetical protein LOAG_03269 [Loa loa]|uniref:Uncharacterized protein n=1 Tax=Loa loa TaxID=7209 RepID=A0A1S0U560_LOALO|nr:hypothetical protein LOAG_03269 [Loa loa]EFO25219.1 hypothetical protein LOAG_03269 [Loa loa]